MHGTQSHLPGIALLMLLVVLAALTVIALFSRRYRRPMGRAAAFTVGGLVAVYLVARGVVEFFIVHYNDPASYQNAWGGPSLPGVFLVHSGPGFLILVAAAVFAWRKIRARRQAGVLTPRLRRRPLRG